MNNLAAAYKSVGRLSDAIPLYEEALELTKAKQGAEHPQALTLMGNLAVAYQSTGRLEEALQLCEQAAKWRAKLPTEAESANELKSDGSSKTKPEESKPEP